MRLGTFPKSWWTTRLGDHHIWEGVITTRTKYNVRGRGKSPTALSDLPCPGCGPHFIRWTLAYVWIAEASDDPYSLRSRGMRYSVRSQKIQALPKNQGPKQMAVYGVPQFPHLYHTDHSRGQARGNDKPALSWV